MSRSELLWKKQLKTTPMSDYKPYSLEQLDNWMHDVVENEDISPQEIYDTIVKVISDSIDYHEKKLQKLTELVSLMGSSNVGIVSLTGPDSKEPIVCAGDDSSPECKKMWNDFWEENSYSEENKQYTEEELNAMCDAASDKEKCREYNLREAEYYNKRAQLDASDRLNMQYDLYEEIKKASVI